jgi:hypothetical protein
MNSASSVRSAGEGLGDLWRGLTHGRGLNRGATWGLMILGALLAFEVFNFSTTEFALRDVLGDLTFAGLPWATVLAIAFCGIDFAGIARIFTPQQGRDEPAEVWYLFGAWLLAAGFNATLTWWGVSVAIAGHAKSASAVVLGSGTVTKVVPIFVAVMVWLIRVLIIGTFSVAGDKLFSTADGQHQSHRDSQTPSLRPQVSGGAALRSARPIAPPVAGSYHAAPKASPMAATFDSEPTYQSLSFDGAPQETSHERRLQ